MTRERALGRHRPLVRPIAGGQRVVDAGRQQRARLGQPLAMERFRGNIWLEGLAPFAEFELVGQTLRIGGATLRVREVITRCKATTANPETGLVDADTLRGLRAGWGHQDFGVYAEVVTGGRVAVGDAAALA